MHHSLTQAERKSGDSTSIHYFRCGSSCLLTLRCCMNSWASLRGTTSLQECRLFDAWFNEVGRTARCRIPSPGRTAEVRIMPLEARPCLQHLYSMAMSVANAMQFQLVLARVLGHALVHQSRSKCKPDSDLLNDRDAIASSNEIRVVSQPLQILLTSQRTRAGVDER